MLNISYCAAICKYIINRKYLYMYTYVLGLGILRNILIVLLIFFSTMSHPAIAQAIDEQGSQLRKMRDILAANPDKLTTIEKKELVKNLDEKLSEIGSAIAITKNYTEWPQILIEIVDLLALPDSDIKHVETKLNAFAEWATTTKQIIKILQSDNRLVSTVPETDMHSGTIVDFSGSGNLTTRPFTVPNGWEIQWSYEPTDALAIGVFTITLYDDTGEFIDLISTQMKGGRSSVYRTKGGRYYLEIKAMGGWKVKVIDVGS